MQDPDEDRLVALETRLAHSERMAEELSDCLLAQGRTIDLLRRQLDALRQRLGDLESGGWSPSPQDEKPPPHY